MKKSRHLWFWLFLTVMLFAFTSRWVKEQELHDRLRYIFGSVTAYAETEEGLVITVDEDLHGITHCLVIEDFTQVGPEEKEKIANRETGFRVQIVSVYEYSGHYNPWNDPDYLWPIMAIHPWS